MDAPKPLTLREIVAPVTKAEWIFWGIALAALAVAVFPGSRAFYLAALAAPGSDAAMLAWDSILFHHVAVLVAFTLPLLFLPRLGLGPGLALFAPGDWKTGLAWTLVACLVATGPAWMSSQDPAFLREYPLTLRAFDSPGLMALFLASYLLYYIGWEAFFRGYLGFGLRALGHSAFHAIMVQVALSMIIHIGKPDMELLSAIPGGIFMGVLAYRTRSLLWPLLFHAYLGALNTYFCWIHQP